MGIEENKVQRIILEYLHKAGYFAWRNNQIPVRGRRFNGELGAADLFCILKPSGRFCAIEAKTLKGKQSDNQKEFEDKVVKSGGVYILAPSFEIFFSEFKKYI